MLEGRVVICDCGCWKIWSYGKVPLLLRFHACHGCMEKGLDAIEKISYLDKVDSVSALDGDGDQLWLT